MYDAIIEFPRMKVAVTTRDDHVAEIRYLPPSVNVKAPTTPLAERAVRQLERYREDPDAQFDLPLIIEGSPFQRRLWDALCTIPRGKTMTYGELARRSSRMARRLGLEETRRLLREDNTRYRLKLERGTTIMTAELVTKDLLETKAAAVVSNGG